RGFAGLCREPEDVRLPGFAYHEVDDGFDVVFRAGSAGAHGWHHVEAVNGVAVKQIIALGNAGRPGGSVTGFRRTGRTGRVAGHAGRVVVVFRGFLGFCGGSNRGGGTRTTVFTLHAD